MKRGLLIKDKIGQFYLMAAIIISVLIIGFATMSNYSRKQESTSVQSAGEELKIESENVLDFGTYNQYNESQMQDLMRNFSKDYVNYVQKGEDSYFLFGNSNQITVAGYSQLDKTIFIDMGSGPIRMDINGGEITFRNFNSPSDNITMNISSTDYQFELKSGENFYFIIFEDSGGEKHVVKN